MSAPQNRGIPGFLSTPLPTQGTFALSSATPVGLGKEETVWENCVLGTDLPLPWILPQSLYVEVAWVERTFEEP